MDNNKPTNKNSKESGKKKDDKQLTEKERAFCRQYVKTGNGTQAIIDAGYKVKGEGSASTIANRLLNKVDIQNEITRLRERAEKKTIATGQEVMEFFTKVMNGEVKDQFGLDASLADRTKAAQELAKRTVDIDNRIAGKPDATVAIKLDWKR